MDMHNYTTFSSDSGSWVTALADSWSSDSGSWDQGAVFIEEEEYHVPAQPLAPVPTQCPPCGSHGFCVDGLCACSDGYTGANCTVKLQSCHPAARRCGNNGVYQNGLCACTDGFMGTFCMTSPSRLVGSESLTLQLHLEMALLGTSARREKFEVDVQNAVSSAVHLPCDRIVIGSLRSGSILVDLLILEARAAGGVSARAAAYALELMAKKGVAIFPAAFQRYWNTSSGVLSSVLRRGTFNGTDSVREEATVFAPLAASDSDHSGGVLWSIAGAILTFFIAAFIFWKLRRRRRRPACSSADPWQTLLGGGQADADNSLSSHGPHDPRRLYEHGCQHFGNIQFIKARLEFDKAIAVLTHRAADLHTIVKLPMSSRHANALGAIDSALADNMPLKHRFDQAVTNTQTQTGEELAKQLDTVLSFFAIHNNIVRALRTPSSDAADNEALWRSIKATGLPAASGYAEQALAMQNGADLTRVLQEAQQFFCFRNMPDPSKLAKLKSDVSLKLLLHKCVIHKIGVVTFLACNRLDRDFVHLAQQPLVQAVDIRHRLRLTLLSLFLSGVSCEPKYRVRYIRYTIKCNMALGNYGLAASYIRLLLKYARSNTDKLRNELARCESHDNDNACEPAAMVPPGCSYIDLLKNVEQARQISSELGDSIGESRELCIIGLVHWQIDAFTKAKEALALSCSTARRSKDKASKNEERSAIVSLRLAEVCSEVT